MKIAAAKALASMVEPNAEKILPLIFDKEVPKKISEAVKAAI
jgi:malic enzyme